MQYSIILTVHNKEFLIKEVVEELIQHTTGHYEIIFVIDGCTDKSFNIIHEVLWRPQNRWINHKFIWADNVFETKANNLGLKAASGQYCIIIQDDIIVRENGWNERLSKPCEAFSDIFAVTARCAHNWRINPNSIHVNEISHKNDCWCDIVMHCDHADKTNTPRNIFRIRRSANRGPLLLRKDIIEKLGYLNEKYHPQDLDDHDLCYRAFRDLKMKCGYFNINVESKDEWGGTRENGQPKPWLLEAQHKNMKIFYQEFKEVMNMSYNEDRILD